VSAFEKVCVVVGILGFVGTLLTIESWGYEQNGWSKNARLGTAFGVSFAMLIFGIAGLLSSYHPETLPK
jgi:hypothetical protein